MASTGKYAQLIKPFGLFLYLIFALVMRCSPISLCTSESNKQELDTSNVTNIDSEEINVSTETGVRRHLSCKNSDHSNELSYLWKQCSGGRWLNLRKNVDNSSVCSSAPGKISCEVVLDDKERNYIFCCTEAAIGSPNNIVTNCSNFTVTARLMPPALVTDRTMPELLTPVTMENFKTRTIFVATTTATDPHVQITQNEIPRTNNVLITMIVIAVFSVVGGLVTVTIFVALSVACCCNLRSRKQNELLQTFH